MFDPDSIKPSQLDSYRQAAESAWGDDTRHENYQGHPQPSAGNCYVTSAWLKDKLGGNVGTKDGHYFWVSPDRRYVIDLTGDQYAYPPTPEYLRYGVNEETEEPWEVDEHQNTWRPGPVMYKRADHPLYKGFRVLPKDRNFENNPRVRLFKQRAEAALRGGHTKKADLLGPTAYPGSTPQKTDEWDSLTQHDQPDYNPQSDLTTQEYKFVFANGQLHVSPDHEHEDLLKHTGMHPESEGPFAAGYVTVNRGHALWEVESNVALRGLHEVLKDYSDQLGWKFDGMVGSNGQQLHDDFGMTSSVWYAAKRLSRDLNAPDSGELAISYSPLPRGCRIDIIGKTAHLTVPEWGWRKEALQEWANDFGYKLAEYPGGTDMTDRMKTKEDLDVYNRGDTDFEPERANADIEPEGPFKCRECGAEIPDFGGFRLHMRDHEPRREEPIENGHFPTIDDFDAPLPLRRLQPVPTAQPVWARVATIVLRGPESLSEGLRAAYSGQTRYNPSDRLYGAYSRGEMLGFAAVDETADEPMLVAIAATVPDSGIEEILIETVASFYPSFTAYIDVNDAIGQDMARKIGMINVTAMRWRYAKGTDPKDMIEEPIPFIYDIKGDEKHRDGHIEIGYAGQQTHHIPGKFTPGGIVEGIYQPGGKIVFWTATSMPWSLRHFANLWYHLFPQMEITSVEQQDQQGKIHKVATAAAIGPYLKTLVGMDTAASKAYEALRAAGGKTYVVGGAIRDALQGREPNDIDMMVAGMPPDDVEHVLSKLPGEVIVTGKRFGVFRYKVGGSEVEIALPRQDKYETSRRGEGVITVDHTLPVEKDLERRDFTANSMAVDLDSGELIDPYGGVSDIDKNILRTTHPDSFREDPTRLVRALVTHGRFGLNPDERTRHEMEAHGHLLRHESPDSINKVLDKLFKSGNPAGAIRLGQDTGILKHLFPEVADNYDFDQNNPHHSYTLGEHTLQVLDNTAAQTTDPDVRMAALLHDVGKPASAWVNPETGYNHYYMGDKGQGADHETVGAQMAHDRLRALNYPVARIQRVQHLVQHHMFPNFNSAKGARKFLQRVGDQHADDLLNLRQADSYSKGQTAEEQAAKTSADHMRALVDQARQAQAPTDISGLSVNGNDLIAMGLKPGPQIGQVLRQLVNHVVETPMDNDRARLLEVARSYVEALPQS